MPGGGFRWQGKPALRQAAVCKPTVIRLLELIDQRRDAAQMFAHGGGCGGVVPCGNGVEYGAMVGQNLRRGEGQGG